MSKKRNREINIFSTSAIDLFASGMGVFIILVMILFPYFTKRSKLPKSTESIIGSTSEFSALENQLAALIEVNEELRKSLEEAESEKDSARKQVESLRSQAEGALAKVRSASLAQIKTDQWQQEIQQSRSSAESAKREARDLAERLFKAEQEKASFLRTIDALKAKATASQSQERHIASEQPRSLELVQKLSEADMRSQNLGRAHRELQAQNQSLARANQALQDSLKDREKILGQLQKQQQASSGSDESEFMAILIQWDTERHDVDLRVRTPKGVLYDFQKRYYPNNPAIFSLDSRVGPGVEVWQTTKVEKGTYSLTFHLYNNYGNEEDARVQGYVFTRKGKLSIPSQSLNVISKRSVQFRLVVDQNGEVRLN